MRRFLIVVALVCAVMLAAAGPLGAQSSTSRTPQPQFTPPPVRPNYGNQRPANVNRYYPAYPGYGYNRYYYNNNGGYYGGYYGGYPTSSYYGGTPVVPIIPTDTLYGPGVVQRQLGLDTQPAAPSGLVRPHAAIGGNAAPADNSLANPSPQHSAGEVGKGGSEQAISAADAMFQAGKYPDAYERYHKAAELYPTVADTYFRQGFTLIANGRWSLAAKAFKRGLIINPSWPDSPWRLDSLYGNGPAKAEHLDNLSKAAEKDPGNPDLLFLTGVFLHFDGHPDRALTFFQRAQQLDGGKHLKAFLDSGNKG